MAGKTGAEADKAEGLEIVGGAYLTVFGATIEHVEGETLDESRRRLAEALIRLLPPEFGRHA